MKHLFRVCSAWMRGLRTMAVTGFAALAMVMAFAAPAGAFSLFPSADNASGTVTYQALPREARDTIRLIRQGGPFPYDRDGIVFGNYEKKLPPRKRGYYTEYTVKTPGVKSRGARRIVAGKGTTGNPATAEEFWYTPDHYETFLRVKP